MSLDDWDAATSARPEEVAALFPDASWENRFGTVTIPGGARPSRSPRIGPRAAIAIGGGRTMSVSASASTEDLARRDFTINAIAWVPDRPRRRQWTGGRSVRRHARSGGGPAAHGRAIRGIASARMRCGWCAPRASPADSTWRSIPTPRRPSASWPPPSSTVSAERIRDELLRMLDDAVPSRALRLLEGLGLLPLILPELAALRGVPQAKIVAGRRAGPLAGCRRRSAGRRSRAPAGGAASRRRQGDHAGRRPLHRSRPGRRRAGGAARCTGSGCPAPWPSRRSTPSASTCTPTTTPGPMRPCGASSVASASRAWRSSSRCAGRTTPPPASGRPARRTRRSSSGGSRSSWRGRRTS